MRTKLFLMLLFAGASLASAELLVDVTPQGPDVVSLSFSGDPQSADQRVPAAWLNKPPHWFKYRGGRAVLKSGAEIRQCVDLDHPQARRVVNYVREQSGPVASLRAPYVGEGGFVLIVPDVGSPRLGYWGVPGVTEPDMATLPSAEDAAAALEDARQTAKSAIHKAADNALIEVLIRGGFLPEGASRVPAGLGAEVTASLLVAEAADPTNQAVQALSSKLDRLRGVIEREGGSVDDAVVHEAGR